MSKDISVKDRIKLYGGMVALSAAAFAAGFTLKGGKTVEEPTVAVESEYQAYDPELDGNTYRVEIEEVNRTIYADAIASLGRDGKVRYYAPDGYKIAKDENGHPYCYKITGVTTKTSYANATAHLEKDGTIHYYAPRGYTLAIDENGHPYCYKIEIVNSTDLIIPPQDVPHSSERSR